MATFLARAEPGTVAELDAGRFKAWRELETAASSQSATSDEGGPADFGLPAGGVGAAANDTFFIAGLCMFPLATQRARFRMPFNGV